MFMTLKWVIPKAELHPEQLGKIFLMIGFVPYAVWGKMLSEKYNPKTDGTTVSSVFQEFLKFTYFGR